MAKSQTKAKITKPPVATKTADAATTAIAMTQDLRMIPLDQLELSQLNVRKVAASATDDAELLARFAKTVSSKTLSFMCCLTGNSQWMQVVVA